VVPNQLFWIRVSVRLMLTKGIGEREKEETARTKRGIIILCDVALRTGYHVRLTRSVVVVVDEAVYVHAFEGITVLCVARAHDD
jgi:hypothetical protein